MATQAQIHANRENAKLSTGATTPEGKEASSRNNFRHGLTCHAFFLLETENPDAFDLLKRSLRGEYQPQTPTEEILVEKMAQYHWLGQRAQHLLTLHVSIDHLDLPTHQGAAVYLRYQTHFDRLFQRALHDLLKLRAERRKAEIGFESQKRAQAQETRRESNETRKQDLHKVKLASAETKFERELLKTTTIKAAHCATPKVETEAKTMPIAA
ncbi:MAG: hypothetical protein JO051_03210 [Acidobacteriaceae bacterium]|nr:hypothetical protein [Acidobacteriaceae bacterium]